MCSGVAQAKAFTTGCSVPWRFQIWVSDSLPMQIGELAFSGITWLLNECCRDCNSWLGLYNTSKCLRVLQSRHQGSVAKQAGTKAAASHGGGSTVRGSQQ